MMNYFYRISPVISKRYFATLLISEHDNQNLAPLTRNALTACKRIGEKVTILVAGNNCKPVSQSLSKAVDVERIYEADHPNLKDHLVENITLLVVDLQKKHNFTHIVAGSSSFGRSLLPRIAGKLDVSPVTDVTSVKSKDTFTRFIYSGSATVTLQSIDKVKILTVRAICFDADKLSGGETKIESLDATGYIFDAVKLLVRDLMRYERPPLDQAEVVVSGGKGLRSKKNFNMIYDLADKLHAGVGCTRAVADAGWAPCDYQIGQSGKVVAPKLYMAVGISGAIQHVVGMRESKTIVAINKDAGAPIFKVADYGIVGDLFKLLPDLTEKLGKMKKE